MSSSSRSSDSSDDVDESKLKRQRTDESDGDKSSFVNKVLDAKRKRLGLEDNKKNTPSQGRKGKSIGEALANETGGSASSWVKRVGVSSVMSRLDEQDEALSRVDGFDPSKSYTADELKGLRVQHDMQDIAVGEDVVLTLTDRNVLDEDDEDDGPMLQSQALVEKQRNRDIERWKKHQKGGVVVFDHDDAAAEDGGSFLQHYDEPKKSSFVIGGEVDKAEQERRLQEARARAALEAKKLSLLPVAETKVASDFLTPEEVAAMSSKGGKKSKKGKKDKKDKKRRKKATSDLLQDIAEEDANDEEDRGSKKAVEEKRAKKGELGQAEELMEKEARYRKALQDAMRATKEKLYNPQQNAKSALEVEEEEELQRRLLLSTKPGGAVAVKKEKMSVAEKLAQRAKEKKAKQAEPDQGGGLVFTTTTEFVKQVKAEVEEEALPPSTLVAVKKESAVQEDASVVDAPIKEEGEVEEGAVTNAEPVVAHGLASTLAFLRMHGGGGGGGDGEGVFSRLHDSSVSKSNKKYADVDDDDEDAGPYKVSLDKYDEFGRGVSRKEAFRLMSHVFHNSNPKAMAQERRLRQVLQERKAREKLSVEATLADVEKMEEAQKRTGQAGIRLTLDTAEMEDLQEEAAKAVKKKLAKMQKKKN